MPAGRQPNPLSGRTTVSTVSLRLYTVWREGSREGRDEEDIGGDEDCSRFLNQIMSQWKYKLHTTNNMIVFYSTHVHSVILQRKHSLN